MTDFDEEKQNKQLEELKREEEEGLIEMLAESKYKIPYADLTKLVIDNEALRVLTEKEANDLKVAPFKLLGKNIFIGVRSPQPELLEKLKEQAETKGLVPSFFMVSTASLEKVWGRYQELSLAENSRVGGIDISADVLREVAGKINTMQDIEKLAKDTLEENMIHKVSSLLEIILAGAIAIQASDVHIEPEQEKTKVRIRLDGVLHDVISFDNKIYHLLNSRIKLLSGMKLTSKTAQDGRFSIEEGQDEINIRASAIPGAYGESLVMRILDPKSIAMKLEDLGIEPYLFSIFNEEIKKPNGLILVTGPTGSGKTTTLYAFLRTIYSRDIKIITIEDPIEYHLNGITQTQTNEDKGYTFLEGLRSALRQDPDVVMVGEIRDKETAKTAIESALTGHMVFSTLHTNNAAGVIPRMIDLEANPKIMASALSLSIAQRLVRKLCKTCRAERQATDEERTILQSVIDFMKENGKDISKFGIDESTKTQMKVFTAPGCTECNMTGYKGRIGIFEAIKTDENIEKIMITNPSEREIKKSARAQGILTMREDGIIKILRGITSFEEVQSVVDLKEE